MINFELVSSDKGDMESISQSMVSINGNTIAFGGLIEGGSSQQSVYIYNHETFVWTKLIDMEKIRNMPTVVEVPESWICSQRLGKVLLFILFLI